MKHDAERARPTRSLLLTLIAALALLATACSAGEEDEAAETSSTTDPGAGSGVESSTTEATDDGGTTTSTTDGAETTSTTETDEETPRPAAFWAVDDLTLDLVLVDTESGAELLRRLGWGADLGGEEPEGGLQALEGVAAGADLIWVSDCCEPAVGNVYGVDPEQNVTVPSAAVSIDGVAPAVSPDGSLVAVQVLDIGIGVHDAATGEQVIDPGSISDILAAPTTSTAPVFPVPLAWIDDSTLAVSISSGGSTAITFVSVENRAVPAAVGSTIEFLGSVVDGSTRADGALVSAVAPDGDTDVVNGLVHDVDSGEQLAAFELPDRTESIDYDPSGTFLLVSTGDGIVSWIGLGESAVLNEGLRGASWATEPRPAVLADPAEAILEPFTGQEVADAGLEGVGCSYYRNGVRTDRVFDSGSDGALLVIDGESIVLQSEGPEDFGPFSSDRYEVTFTDVGDRVPSSIESNERTAEMVVTPADGGDEITVDVVIWCGV